MTRHDHKDEQERYKCYETGNYVQLGRLVSMVSGTHHQTLTLTRTQTWEPEVHQQEVLMSLSTQQFTFPKMLSH